MYLFETYRLFFFIILYEITKNTFYYFYCLSKNIIFL